MFPNNDQTLIVDALFLLSDYFLLHIVNVKYHNRGEYEPHSEVVLKKYLPLETAKDPLRIFDNQKVEEG